jgi:hypothetical protein
MHMGIDQPRQHEATAQVANFGITRRGQPGAVLRDPAIDREQVALLIAARHHVEHAAVPQ